MNYKELRKELPRHIGGNDKIIANLMSDGIILCIREAQKFYDEGFDLVKATNAGTHPDEFQEQFFNIYIKLFRLGATVEAYILLRMAFGNLSTNDILEIYDKGLTITENLAYQAAEHDKEDLPF